MKKCPYCAEMIQDEAIKCRYCHSDLTVVPPTAGSATTTTTEPDPTQEPAPSDEPSTTSASPAVQATPTPAPSASSQPVETSSVRYTHSGFRYVLGYGADFFGIWDRQSPSVAAERFERTDDGWRQAWLRFSALEPDHTTVPADGSAAAAPVQASTPSSEAVAMDPDDTAAVQYTHSGTKYLLGYGRTFFGIWDRTSPDHPVERFARDDSGWAAAWSRYTQIESNFSEVKLS